MNAAKTSQAIATLPARGSHDNIQNALSEVVKGVNTKLARRSEFVTSVISVADDRSRVKVKLCTGKVIDVPMSILKNVRYLGSAKTEEDSFEIASGEIDISTDTGILIQQMAHEITRLSRSLHASQERFLLLQNPEKNKAAQIDHAEAPKSAKRVAPFDTTLPETIVKIPFTGIAGFPKAVTYGVPTSQYLQDWSIFLLKNCFLTQPPQVIETGHDGNRPDRPIEIQFVLDAAHGTALFTTYNAQLELDVVLVQETT